MAATTTPTARSGQANGDEAPKRPERTFRVGSCWATVWCNEIKQDAGPNQQTTRLVRSVNLERRFWNPKLKEGQGDYDSSSGYGLGEVHNAIAALELAAAYIRSVEADVTRGFDFVMHVQHGPVRLGTRRTRQRPLADVAAFCEKLTSRSLRRKVVGVQVYLRRSVVERRRKPVPMGVDLPLATLGRRVRAG